MQSTSELLDVPRQREQPRMQMHPSPLGRACPDYLVGSAYPEVLEQVGLPPGPGDELV